MTQREFEQQLSKQTGESIQTIRQRGFSPLRESIPIEERNRPLMVDWDLEDLMRHHRSRQN